MRKRTLLTAMLTPVAVLTATAAIAGCGGKANSSSQGTTSKSGGSSTTTTSAKHKPRSKAPAY
jgi:hypothetical protein